MDELMYILIFFTFGYINRLSAGVVSQIYIKDNATPIKNSALQIICDITDYTNGVTVSESSTSNGEKKDLNSCNNQICLSPSKGGADYTVQGNTITITIASLNRTRDQKYWWCQEKSVFLEIYTVPKTLQFDNAPSQDQDLALISVTLKCSTGCSYPQPSFSWYFREDGGSQQVWSSSGSVTDTTDGCTDSEKIYTTSLSLGRFSTLPQNLYKIVKFLCGISTFPGMSQPLYSAPSVDVTFAVRVTSATLKDGTNTPSVPLQVVSGVSKTLTCETSLSRPTATIVWYIDNVEKQRSTTSSSLTFTPQNSDHNKQIYCKAFNIQPESQAVASVNATLFVQVRVTSAKLKDGPNSPTEPLQVVSGVSKTLTCETSFSRPTATIVWYIDNVEKQRSSSSSSFTFTPHNSDHNKQIYCKAFNIQPESQAVASVKAILYVKVKVTAVSLKYNNSTPSDTLEANNGISKTLTCSTSDSRPTATIVWYIGDEEQRRSTESTSSLNFIPDMNYNGSLIYCTAFNIQQEQQAVSSSKIVLHITETVFYIEGEEGQIDVTVDEYDTNVKLMCQVNSFLESKIMITFQDVVLKEQIQTKAISFTRASVTCLHAGVYTCKGSNQNGPAQSAYINLFVRCSPRPLKQIKSNFTSPLYTSVTLRFPTLAYPEPGPTGFVWQQDSGTGWTPLRSNTDIQISSSGLQSNLTILNVSIVDYGQYRITVTNAVGSYGQNLFLVQEDITIYNKCNTSLGNEQTGLIIGTSLGALVLVLVFYGTYVTVLLKKERSKKGNGSSKPTNYCNLAEDVDQTERQSESRNTSGRNENEDSVKLYTDLARYSKGEGSTYDIIQKV